MKQIWLIPALCAAFFATAPSHAAPPMADSLALAGIMFDDKPAQLPVTENFQAAMASVTADFGLSCMKTEAYGWRLAQTEQERVNQIFNGTVEKLRTQNYAMTAQTPASATREVTMFTAQKAQQNLAVLWSAGDLGLVLLVCETQPTAMNTGAGDDPVAEPAPVPAKKAVKKPAKKPSRKTTQSLNNMALNNTALNNAAKDVAALPEAEPPLTVSTTTPPEGALSPQAPATPQSLSSQRMAMPLAANAPMSPDVQKMLDTLPAAPPAAKALPENAPATADLPAIPPLPAASPNAP